MSKYTPPQSLLATAYGISAKATSLWHTCASAVRSIIVRTLRLLILTVGVSCLVAVLATSFYVYQHVSWALQAPIPSFGVLQNRHVGESTKLYDRTGTVLLYDTNGSMRRTIIPLDEISPHVRNATIAIEDSSFYTHPGVRTDAILRALLSNIRSGSLGQGGSTITQQLIKNTLLTEEKLFSRKIREFVLALRIEETLTKDEILQKYLNETPYGGTIYGVEEASHAFFGKSAKDVTLSEAAYLAALPKAPTYFSPWGSNQEALEERQALVLRNMLEQSLITQAEYAEAHEETVLFASRSNKNIKAPHFVFYVLEQLEEEYGKERVYGGNLQVVTSLDWEMQQEHELIIHKGALENEKKFNASNASLVAINPKNGEILSMIGSRDYFDDAVAGQVNVAVSNRQPGSVFKPIVYATAFQKGFTPDTVLFDLKTQFSTACAPSDLSNEYPCYSPGNYDDTFRGPMTIRDALAQSVNIVGVKALYLSGINATMDTARSMGISTLVDPKRYGLSLVLGGGEVKLLEITGAYGAFANDGAWYAPTPILSIHIPDGSAVYTHKAVPEQVLAPEIARAINDILADNEARAPAFGYRSPLYFEHTTVAAKTGTTNDYRDMWVIGYTPDVVVGSWAGNSDNTPMVKSISAFILAPMWHEAMEQAIARYPSTYSFVAYKSNEDAEVSTSSSVLHASFFDPPHGVREIFYWMHRNTRTVEGAPNPYQDPQIARWGYAVARWAAEQTSRATASGFGVDGNDMFGIGGADGVPLEMSITKPKRGSVLERNKPFTVTIDHSELDNVTRVTYYLHGEYVGSSTEVPFSISITGTNAGVTVLRAVAESPLGNKEALTTFSIAE
jgi:penicillin-binding protein 1C